MKVTITPYHFEELIKKSYSLDQIYLLRLVEQEFDITDLCKNSLKIAAIYQSLIRKGLLTENNNLTVIGKDLLIFMDSKQTTKLIKKKPVSSDFSTWWESYPGTNTFTHANVLFSGSRTLRVNKDVCRREFDNILNEGEYTAQEIINATKFDVLQKKEESVKTKNNMLQYMQSSTTYLNQRSFGPYVELIKNGQEIKVTSSISRGTDI